MQLDSDMLVQFYPFSTVPNGHFTKHPLSYVKNPSGQVATHGLFYGIYRERFVEPEHFVSVPSVLRPIPSAGDPISFLIHF